MPCPFCDPAPERISLEGPLTVVLRDLYPVTAGHLLVIPRRHCARWSETTSDERLQLFADVDRARELATAADPTIEGFNIGWNDGPAAGQTVMHLHLHVIPRRLGDVADPRGGVRWVIPDRARYWTE